MMNFEWRTKEHNHGERNAEWYVAVGVIAIAIIATSIIFNNILLAIVIAIGFITIIITHKKGPQDIVVNISRRGIQMNDVLYVFDSLESFYVDRERHHIILKSQKFFSSHIIIPFAEDMTPEDLDAVEDFLDDLLPEEEMHESIFEIFMEYLGF